MKFEFNEKNITEEFMNLSAKSSALPEIVHVKAEWKSRNRYSDIQPYDEYRVIIKDKTIDYNYINATHWQLAGLQTKFIATQAPLQETIPDFWSMIEQNNCSIIISLIKFNKRHPQFWLTDGVNLVEEVYLNDMVFRRFEYSSKSIVQIQYLDWPDHGVPEDLKSFNNFVMKCENLINSNSGTVVVHCSAGMGRTGTLVSILASRMNITNADIPSTVFELRRRRHKSLVVESLEQYKLIYKALASLPPISDYELHAGNY